MASVASDSKPIEKKTVEEWRKAKSLSRWDWAWSKAYHSWAEGKLLTEDEFDEATKKALKAEFR